MLRSPETSSALTAFDPRTTLARDDLADQALEGVVRAERYRRPETLQGVVPAAPLRREPGHHGEQFDQVLFGELFEALDEQDGWLWGRARRGGYVGWVEAGKLAGPVLTPTHRVSAIRTFALPEPDFRAAPPTMLTLNAMVTVEERAEGYARVARAGWVPDTHLADLLSFETDPAAVAERHLGSPYQWGARESTGVDCSGLVQQAFFACGRACPRDADQQELQAGDPIEPGDGYAGLRRGDLVFWDGHVGVMADATRLIHANVFHMQVTIEPLAAVIERKRAEGAGEPTRFRRP